MSAWRMGPWRTTARRAGGLAGIVIAVLAVAAPLAHGQDAARGPRAAGPSYEASEGPLAVVLRLDSAAPALGAPLALHFEATLDAEPTARLVWPDVRRLVREEMGEDVAEVDSARVAPDGRSLEAVLRLYDEGEHALPAFTISAQRSDASADGSPDTFATVTIRGASVTVTTDVPDDAEPAPARDGIALVPPPAPFPWTWVLGAVAVIVVVAAAVIWVRRRPKPVVPPPPPTPAHELALAALRDLASRGLLERGAVEPYFVELSEILRRYLEDRFGLRAPEQTTEEFLADVSRTDAGRRAIEAAQRDVLREFLTQADLVKFARETPSADDCRAAGDVAERFVVATAASTADGSEESA